VRCDDQVVVVVGGAGGIGGAAAALFADQGATVVVADCDEAGASEVARDLPGATGCFVDVTSLASCRELVDGVMQVHGRVDIMATTVGWTDTTFLVNETEDYWQKIVAINLMGCINMSRAVMEPMIAAKRGAIVLTSSEAGRVGAMGETVYAAAKAGVVGFTKSFAREVARDGIRINAVSPGLTDTPLFRAQSDQSVLDKVAKSILLKRLGDPMDQANAIVFLGSAASAYITGQTLSVSGGLTMCS
jgi:NAD(P)-dependent dehydrogenase (short-subunit alcohol dehydrogenase family)